MSNPTKLRVNSFWRSLLVGVVLLAASSCLLSQGAAISQQARSSAGQLFAGLDDSLSNAADRILVSADQTAPVLIGNVTPAKTPSDIAANQDEHATRPSGDRGLSAAELRLNLLRPAVEPILRSHGVPTDLAAVILVESAGRSTALSPKGARGLWQLMPDTARRYGLRVDETRDDRLDLFKSTDAAARYLHDLYAQFGDWKLALAAYNTGEAHLGEAILKARTQDFDQLANLRLLPLETRNYVPRVLVAAQLITHSSTLGEGRSPVSGRTFFAVSNP